ncbi:MAG TPA: helix-turn-helix transcriptional regulator [Chitinophagaceae bacterium]|nr:helix-turn-helix transcriptional regulator [Chitinophagaceae bacterium]
MTARQKEQQKFGANLRKIREAKKISIHELAALSELEYGQLQKTETGQVNPTLYTIVRIAKGLGIQPSELLKY